MILRLRIDDVNPVHTRLTVFEGREHGANMGNLVVDTPEVSALLTIGESQLDGTWQVRLIEPARVR